MTLIFVIERLETWSDQDVLVRTCGVCAPGDLSGLRIESREPAADAELSATVADQNFPFRNQGSHGHALALVDIADAGSPDLLPGVGVNTDGLIVQRVVVDPAVVVRRSAVYDIAASDPLRGRRRCRFV